MKLFPRWKLVPISTVRWELSALNTRPIHTAEIKRPQNTTPLAFSWAAPSGLSEARKWDLFCPLYKNYLVSALQAQLSNLVSDMPFKACVSPESSVKEWFPPHLLPWAIIFSQLLLGLSIAYTHSIYTKEACNVSKSRPRVLHMRCSGSRADTKSLFPIL